MPTADVLAHLRELTFEQSLHMGHPAYFAYITGAGTVPGAAAEFLAAGLNQCSGGYRLGPGAAEIELHLTRWLASRFGLPEGSGGMIMTGGAMANFVGLKCARDQRLGVEVRDRGVAAAGPVAIYASEEAHVVIRRAADMLGLGADAVRAIAVDGEQRMRAGALEEALAARRRRRRPPARGLGHRGHDHDGLDRPAPGARGAGARARRVAPRRRRVRRRGRALGHAAPAARRHGARGLDRRRPAQVDVHAAVGGLRAHARLRAPQPLLPRRRLLHLARRRGPPGDRLRHARAAVLARLRGAQGLDLAARPRPRSPTRGGSSRTSRSPPTSASSCRSARSGSSCAPPASPSAASATARRAGRAPRRSSTATTSA